MKKYVCTVCGRVYDPEEGDPNNAIVSGTAFEELPEGWSCLVCGADRTKFKAEDETPHQ